MTISTEQLIPVVVGASENDGTGDPLRDAFIKINDNFSAITDVGFVAGNIQIQGSVEFGNSNDNVLTLPNYTVSTAPLTAEDGSLIWVTDGDAGSPTLAVSVSNTWLVVPATVEIAVA